MKKFNFLVAAITLFGSAAFFQSCDDDDDVDLRLPTAIVTVCPGEDGSFVMNLDNETVLQPTNMKKSPFGKKEVRALVNYTETAASESKSVLRNVQVNWIDSIRTKAPVHATGIDDDEAFGNDPVEIVADWVTVAEDGYITLRVRTLWGNSREPHVINLVTGVNPEDPYEMELCHDAKGDVAGYMGDALIAFNLNDMPDLKDTVKIKLRWESFSGEKTAEFDLKMRDKAETPSAAMLDNSLCGRSLE